LNNTLIISDCHFPYHHRDTFKFLKAVYDVYGLVDVKHTGDMVDNHSASYHEIEYGSLSAKEEHKQAKKAVQKLSEMFPKMDVVIGNHGKLSFRKAKTAGIPEEHLKDYNSVYGVDWNWDDHFYFKVNKYGNCLLTHTMGATTLSNARNLSHQSLQGHNHGRFVL